MATWTRVDLLLLILLLIGGACASDPVVIPSPQPEPVRMLSIGAETDVPGMAMAAGPDDLVATTAAPSLPTGGDIPTLSKITHPYVLPASRRIFAQTVDDIAPGDIFMRGIGRGEEEVVNEAIFLFGFEV